MSFLLLTTEGVREFTSVERLMPLNSPTRLIGGSDGAEKSIGTGIRAIAIVRIAPHNARQAPRRALGQGACPASLHPPS
jgi:hypothetical protein